MRQLEGYFRALGDVSRLRIINLLLRGELCGCDIQRVLGTSQPNVSRHLNYLKHAGFVSDRRDGPRVFYRLLESAPAALEALLACLAATFQADETLRQDLQRLSQTLQGGACASVVAAQEYEPCLKPPS